MLKKILNKIFPLQYKFLFIYGKNYNKVYINYFKTEEESIKDFLNNANGTKKEKEYYINYIIYKKRWWKK